MLRDLDRLRRVADWLSDDLNRTVPQEWSCRVEDDYVLVVRNQEREERVALNREVATDNWPDEAWAPEFKESTLDDDAFEMLSEEVVEVLRLWDLVASSDRNAPICRNREKVSQTSRARPGMKPARTCGLYLALG